MREIGSVAAALRGRRVRTPPGLVHSASHETLFIWEMGVYNSNVRCAASIEKFLKTACKFSRLHAGKPPGGGYGRFVSRLFLGSKSERTSDTVFRGQPTSLGPCPNKRDEPTRRISTKSRLCHGATWWSHLKGRRLYSRARWVSPTSSAAGVDGPKAVSQSLGDHIASRIAYGFFPVTVCRDVS